MQYFNGLVSCETHQFVCQLSFPPLSFSQKAFDGTTAPRYWSRNSTAASKKSCPSVSVMTQKLDHTLLGLFWMIYLIYLNVCFFSKACGNKVDPVYEALRFGTSLAQKAKRASGSDSPHRNSVRKKGSCLVGVGFHPVKTKYQPLNPSVLFILFPISSLLFIKP